MSFAHSMSCVMYCKNSLRKEQGKQFCIQMEQQHVRQRIHPGSIHVVWKAGVGSKGMAAVNIITLSLYPTT